jgi:hypothetical protein
MSDNTSLFKMRPWGESIPDTFALDQYENGAIDMGIGLTAAFTPNGLGLAHEVIPPARHLALFGVVAAPLDLPADFAGNAVQMRNHQRPVDCYASQEKNRPVLRSAFVTGIPDRILRLAEVNESLRHHAHVSDIIADLKAKLPLTHRDLDHCMEGVKKQYPRGTLIRPFVADQLRFLGYLDAGGHGLSNRDAVRLLQSAFCSNKTDKADFGPALAEYLKDHGGVAAQTPANWCAFVTQFVEDRLDHHAESNSALRRGNANSAVAVEDVLVTSISGPLAVEFQAFMAQKNKAKEPPRRSKCKATAISGVLPSGPAQPGDPLYYWTHGAVGHASGGCNQPHKNHISSATFRNQQKRTPAYL